jgi:ketosteroid isomerase-like protein
VILILPVALAGCQAPGDHPEIRGVLGQQQAAWNRGDLDGFMAHYWKSDELTFRSPKGETCGWQAVRHRYRQAYPTKEKMGTLRFEISKIAMTGTDAAEVAGRYRQELPDGPQTGRFYLHLSRVDGAWVIVRDYTIGD